MGSAVYISIKDKPAGLDWIMDGKSMAAAWEALDALAPSIGVPSITKLCNPAWKAPEKGLPVFEKYLEHIQNNPTAVPESAGVIEDLKDVVRLIGEAKRLNTKWRLMLDY